MALTVPTLFLVGSPFPECLTSNYDGTFTPSSTCSGFPPDGISAAVADFDGDGRDDIFVGLSSPECYVKLSTMGDVASPFFFPLPSDYYIDVEAADMNNDGHPDVILIGHATGNKLFLQNDGSGLFPVEQVTLSGYPIDPTSNHPAGVCLHDFNGDGFLDAVEVYGGPGEVIATSPGPVVLYLNDGTGLLTFHSVLFSTVGIFLNCEIGESTDTFLPSPFGMQPFD